jgi:hypothetical protein
VTYFGGAFGEVDIQARRISGFANASSEFSATVNTNQQQNNLFFGQTNVSQTNSSNVVASGRSYVANLNWEGKITSTQPQLRFNGNGALAVISPTGQSAIAGLAFRGYSELVTAINQSVSQSGGLLSDTDYPGAQLAIGNALAGLVPYLDGSGPTSSYLESERVRIKVSGYRRFF